MDMSYFLHMMQLYFNKVKRIVCRTAQRVVHTVKFKAQEKRQLDKQQGLICELGSMVYELSKQNAALPEETRNLLEQIAQVDAFVNALRQNHADEEAQMSEQRRADEAADAESKANLQAAHAAEKTKKAAANSIVPEATVEPEVQAAVNPVPQLNVEEAATEDEAETEQSVPTLHV